MTATANLGLPLIAAAQAQKHVTHNEAIVGLDALVQLAVVSRTLAAPPGAPVEGQRWIVAAGATGAWAGHAGEVALWHDGAWTFYAPKAGWIAFVIAESLLVSYDGAAWSSGLITVLQDLALLGVGTTADAANPFSTKLNNVLHAAKTVAEGGTGDIRVKLSKESAGKTASYLFQTSFSGRAEFGLAGDDDFHIKVSPDGATWTEAIRVSRSTGFVSFPAMGGPRETLTAARTYYVRPDGSDTNTGLANTASGAFLTVQRAVDVVTASLDMGTSQVTIQVGAGTYTGQVTLKPYLGSTPPIIVGDETTPANVLISPTAPAQGAAFKGDGAMTWHLRGMKLQPLTTGRGLWATGGTIIKYQKLDFAQMPGLHIYVAANSTVECTGNYWISGGSTEGAHWGANGWLLCSSRTITISNTPDFSGIAFVLAGRGATIEAFGNTFSGTGCTGKRFLVSLNGVIFVNGANPNTYFPGSVDGVESAFDPVQ